MPSLVIVVGLAGVVAVFTALLAMAAGFNSTLESAGRADVALVLRGGSQAELNSGISREQGTIIKQAPGIAKGADGQPLASAEVVVIAELMKPGEKTGLQHHRARRRASGIRAAAAASGSSRGAASARACAS